MPSCFVLHVFIVKGVNLTFQPQEQKHKVPSCFVLYVFIVNGVNLAFQSLTQSALYAEQANVNIMGDCESSHSKQLT